MTGRRTDEIRKPRSSWKRTLNLAVAALVLLLGPIMVGVGSFMIGADDELERTGAHAAGTIVRFDDVTKASERRMKVEFTVSDGSAHAVWAAVDHDQHPVVGTSETVAYVEQDPGRSLVLGYESDGVWVRGVGLVLTFLFGGLGLLFVLLMVGVHLKGRLRRAKGTPAP